MYGLVLEGGGSKGSYQIGACKALHEMNIEISCVAGTSVGALNGAMIVQNDLEKAYDMWYNISPSMIMNLSDEEIDEPVKNNYKPDNFNSKLRKIKKIIVEKGLDISPLINTVSNVILEDKIRSSKIDFGIVTVDLTERKAIEVYKENIPKGKLVDYLIASASFPGFKLQTIDGKLFIDGGFYNALPINLVKDKGCKDIIVIRTFALGRKRRVDTSGLNLINIAPSENLGAILDFTGERARKNLFLGYYDAIKAFKNLKGRQYYIKPFNDDSYFLKYLFELSDDKIYRISNLFGIEKVTGKRALFEHIIPKTAGLLGISDSASYEDISIAIIEHVAETCGIERFKIYSIEELLAEISRLYKPVKDDLSKEIPGFLRGMDIVSKIVKDKIIESIAGELFEGIINHIG